MDRERDSWREKVAKEEIRRLKEKQYITSETYEEIIQGYEQWIKDEQRQTEVKQETLAEEPKETPDEGLKSWSIQKEASAADDASAETESGLSKPAATTVDQPHEKSPSKPAPEPKSAQEIRDRNITWSLSIGIMLLLVGGTVLATSSWEIMADWMKTGMIAVVALLFFGLGILTKNVLQIDKTALAFYVLGNLFLPIVYLSLGFYEQLGSYLSLEGEGRYLYGAIGSMLLLATYLYAAQKLGSRLFVWFANVMLTLFAGFLIGWLDVTVDGFYLGIILVNTVFIGVYRYLRKTQRWPLFVTEFATYIQANLILSTLLLLVFYSHEVFHGFNLILTAAVYMAMLYATRRTEYFFVFAVMLVYGAYQVIEFSMLHQIDAIAYGLLGFIFLAVPKLLDGRLKLERLFQYTSAVVAGMAFIFISFQGLILRMDDPSMVLVLAYLLLAANYIYLSYLIDIKTDFFHYLSSTFLLASLFELVHLGQEFLPYDTLAFPMFVASAVFYVGIGHLLTLPYVYVLQPSARDLSAMVMFICLMFELGVVHWTNLGIMLLVLSALAIVVRFFEKRIDDLGLYLVEWLQAILFGLAVTMFYMAVQAGNLQETTFGPFEPVSLVFASVALLVAAAVWHVLKQDGFSRSSFFMAQIAYLSAILGMLSIKQWDMDPTLRSVIMLGGIIMAYLLYREVKSRTVPYVMGIVTLFFYVSMLVTLHDQFSITSELFISLQFPIGALLLFALMAAFWQFDGMIAQAYGHIAHVYYPFAFVFSLLYGDIAVWSTIMAVVIYGLSTWYTRYEWMRKAFLYAAFTSLWLVVVYSMFSFSLDEEMHYSWLVTTVLLTVGWLFADAAWRKRMVYYILPFSVLGTAIFATLDPFDITLFLVALLYAGIVLVLLHSQRWDVLNGIPLLLVFVALIRFIHFHPDVDYVLMALAAVIFLVLGLLDYRKIYTDRKHGLPLLDWYTIAGFVSLAFLYMYAGDMLLQQLLPGILVSLAVFLQRNRVNTVENRWIYVIAAGYLLEPYYTWLGHIDIPPLIEAESYVLPWFGLAIFVKFMAGAKHRNLMNYIQWAVLVIVSLILIQDGLESNTVYDAVILGSLSLASMLGGMFFRQKSFFFAGSGVLLLNLFIQTRPFWGNMPWWAYLLIAGSILITVASYYEWHKQKTSKGKATMMTQFYRQVIQRIRDWE